MTDDQNDGPIAGAMRSITLGGAVGWLHPAGGGRGVVIVGAHGHEDLCSRVTFRELASGLARSGLPTLRLDPRDTGDAADLAPDADRIGAWVEDTKGAVGWLREVLGVEEVVLVGFRIGALIAARAAIELGGVDHLVLMAPPASGRAHRRELSILAKLVDGPGGALDDGSVEIAGFRLDAATLKRLEAIDLTALPGRTAPVVTLVGEGGAAALGRIAEALTARGARVECLPFPGYARMMCDPTASEPALETVAALVPHLAAGVEAFSASTALEATPPIAGDGFLEDRFVFGDGLAGVLTRPAVPHGSGRSAIWLNSGRNHHIGWARQAVDLSRRLARSGVSVLRIDLAGIGDSPPHAHTPATALYHDVGRADVTAAIEEMARRGFARPWLIGACSGAYQVFHAAVADPRVAGIVVVNQLCFVWDASYAVHLSAWMRARPGEFEADARRAEESDSAVVPESALRRVVKLARRGARIGLDTYRKLVTAGSAGRPGPIETAFRNLSARGCAVSIVLSEGDKAIGELELHTGRDGARIAGLPGVEILRIPDADHSLTQAAARERLGHHLVARLAGDGSATSSRPGGGGRPDVARMIGFEDFEEAARIPSAAFVLEGPR